MEVDCDVCGAYSDSPNAKTVCIHCFRKLEKEVIKLRKKIKTLVGTKESVE